MMRVIKFRNWIYVVALLFVSSNFCLSHPINYSDVSNEPDSLNGADLLAKGDSLYDINQIGSAKVAFLLAIKSFKGESNKRGLIEAYNKLGYCQRISRKYKEAKAYLDSASRTISSATLDVKPLRADNFYYYGDYYARLGNADSAIFYHKQALEIRKALYGEADLLVAESLQGLGDVNNYVLENYQEAKQYYQQVMIIKRTLVDGVTIDLARTYYNAASVARSTEDIDLAIVYGEETLKIAKQFIGTHDIFLANTYVLLGNIYFNNRDFDLAIPSYQNGIELYTKLYGKENRILSNFYNNLGNSYKGSKQFDLAIQAHEKALDIARKGKHLYEESRALLGLGIVAYDSGNPSMAKSYLEQSVSIKKQWAKKRSAKLFDQHKHLGNLYRQSADYDSALYYYQSALVNLVKGFEQQNIHANPVSEDVVNSLEVVDILDDKAVTLIATFQDKVSGVENLKLAFNTCLLADSLISGYRSEFMKEGSRLRLESNIKRVYEHAIHCAFLLDSLKGGEQYKWKALELMEKSKATILLETVKSVETFNRLGVPDSVSTKQRALNQREYELRHQLDTLNDLAGNELKENVQSQLFKVTQEQEMLREYLVSVYPRYFRSKLNNTFFGLNELQSFIGEDNVDVIEYFYGSNFVYAIGVVAGEITFSRIGKPVLLSDKIKEFLNLVTRAPNDFKQNYIAYTALGNELYDVLIKPIVADTALLSDRLLIVPDGLMAYLPFDCLLTGNVQSTDVDYKKLPYLINKVNSHYAYSLSLSKQISRSKKTYKRNKVLAFSYSNFKPYQNTSDSRISLRRDGDQEIPGTGQELEIISNLMNGRFFVGSDATEEKFKEHAEDYNIFHFALHGSADSASQLGPRLLFRQNAETVEDNQLYAYEVYNLELDAQLVVLSACETGLGKLQDGEGVYSMGRAFTYAGCPSVVMSLWDIYDRSTEKLISEFYRNLSSGNQVDQALHYSKLSYLDGADEKTAHPFFWAFFISIGDENPLAKESIWLPNNLVSVLIVILIATLVFVVIRRLRSKRMI
ncbi:MAG: CHAT domain-containing tetratricopeptide repeat protein [Bacteroidota bacterium]